MSRESRLLIGALLVLLAHPAAAQQRPLVTEDPETIGAGRILIEGGIEYVRFPVTPDTPDAFGNAAAIQIGGALPVMFTSEGMFTDANGDPTNATISLGVPNQASTATAITILGTTANIRGFRWDGSRWIE